jgi:hypothetical protein
MASSAKRLLEQYVRALIAESDVSETAAGAPGEHDIIEPGSEGDISGQEETEGCSAGMADECGGAGAGGGISVASTGLPGAIGMNTKRNSKYRSER